MWREMRLCDVVPARHFTSASISQPRGTFWWGSLSRRPRDPKVFCRFKWPAIEQTNVFRLHSPGNQPKTVCFLSLFTICLIIYCYIWVSTSIEILVANIPSTCSVPLMLLHLRQGQNFGNTKHSLPHLTLCSQTNDVVELVLKMSVRGILSRRWYKLSVHE